MLRSLAVGAYSVLLGVRFWRDLGIRTYEAGRYLAKLLSLGILFAAFVKPTTGRGLVAAGRAAFISCAYDVVTDWRSFAPQYRREFERQLNALVPDWAVEMAMDLYRRELHNALEEGGLERGVVTVEFVTGLAGSRRYFRDFGIGRLGRLLQIVDDVLDYEQDSRRDELNCLRTPFAALHLASFEENLQQLLFLFRSDRMMRLAIKRASRRADPLRKELRL